MKIAVYGATGNIGRRIVAEAARRGHEVTALSRTEGATPPGIGWQYGDAADVEAVAKIAVEHDVVISAIGPALAADGEPDAFVPAIRGLGDAVGAARLAVVGGAGSLHGADGVRLVDSPAFPAAYRHGALLQAAALAALQEARADLDWVYLSPAPEIGPGERTGSYRIGQDEPAGPHVSYEDYAMALLDELERPAQRRARFTVAN
jgi:hypothetical protein